MFNVDFANALEHTIRMNGKKMLDIRKYPNRRYYDATNSRHLTLEQILELVREGHDIKVTDSKTGADITAQVLTQMILELETRKIENLPVALLLNIIRSNDQFIREFVEKYFNQALAAYLQYQKQMANFVPFAGWPGAMTNPLEGTRFANSADSNTEELREVIAKLQKQVDGLQTDLKKAKKRRT